MLFLDKIFSAISYAFSVRKNLPDAIGYEMSDPQVFPLPELASKCLENSGIHLKKCIVISFHFYNQSEKIQKDVRILLNGKCQFDPAMRLGDTGIAELIENKNGSSEIRVNEVYPGQSIYIQFFNPDLSFRLAQVLVNEREVTPLMQNLARALRYPQEELFRYLPAVTVAVAILFFGALGYFYYLKISENNFISNVLANKSPCAFIKFHNSVGQDALLERRFRQQSALVQELILSFNNVSSFDELKVKDDLLLCVKE
jgi:hypothetical protein